MLSSPLKFIAKITALPVIVYALLLGVNATQRSEWRAALISNGVPDGEASQLSIPAVCGDPALGAKVADVCSSYERVQYVRVLMLFAVAVGLLFTFAAWWAGRRCQTDRELLLRVFRPGLHVTNGIVIVLVIMYAVGLIAAIWYAETTWLNMVHLKIILLVALGAVLGVTQIIRGSARMIHEILIQVVGKAVSRRDAPRLWQLIDDVARNVGTAPPGNVIAGLEPNFFVTESQVTTSDGTLSGRTLYVSLPLCRALSVTELKSIIGHELGHFMGEDTKFSLKFYPIYRGVCTSVQGVATAASSSGAGGWALVPALHVYGFFLECFAVAENKISRDRELVADRAAAACTSSETFGSALTKVVRLSAAWEELHGQLADCFRKTVEIADRQYTLDEFYRNISRAFLEFVRAQAGSGTVRDLDERKLAHPTDTHPPLSVRLAALGAVSEVPAELVSTASSESLFDRIEELEETLSTLHRAAEKATVLAQVEASQAAWAAGN